MTYTKLFKALICANAVTACTLGANSLSMQQAPQLKKNLTRESIKDHFKESKSRVYEEKFVSALEKVAITSETKLTRNLIAMVQDTMMQDRNLPHSDMKAFVEYMNQIMMRQNYFGE